MLALLHTSPVHGPVFDALRDRDHPGLELRHLVRPELLERARREGADAVVAEVAGAVGEAAAGARAVLCTCSTIGGAAEAAGARAGVPVLRVDRPMAAAAARYGRVVVVAAVASTLAPTADLIRDEARAAGSGAPRVRTVLVEGAWERFEAGDRDGYLDAVARAVTALNEADADAVVLAQASMADAAARATTPLPVLSSPALGLRAAAEVVARA